MRLDRDYFFETPGERQREQSHTAVEVTGRAATSLTDGGTDELVQQEPVRLKENFGRARVNFAADRDGYLFGFAASRKRRQAAVIARGCEQLFAETCRVRRIERFDDRP